MVEFKWTKPRERAAKLLAEDALTDEQIAAQVGVTPRQLWNWKAAPAFSDRIAEIVAAYRDAIKAEGIANVKNRVAAQNDRWERMQAVIAERAASEEMANVPGGKTGLLVHTYKLVGGKEPVVMDEYAVDTGLLSELRAHEKQAAQELGQWTEKQEVTGKGGKPIAIATAAFDWAEYQRLYGDLTGIPAPGGDAAPDDGAGQPLDPPAP